MQRTTTLTSPGIELHKQAIGRLVQAIKGQPSPTIADGHLEIAHGTVARDQTFQYRRIITAHAISLKELPVVKVGTIAQAKASHEAFTIQFDCLCQRADTGGTHLAFAMPMGTTLGQQAI